MLKNLVDGVLSLCYTDVEVAGLHEARLRAFRRDGAQWTTPISTGLTVYTTTNCVQLTGIHQFSAGRSRMSAVAPNDLPQSPCARSLRLIFTKNGCCWYLGVGASYLWLRRGRQ